MIITNTREGVKTEDQSARVIASNWEEEDNGGKKGELPCQT